MIKRFVFLFSHRDHEVYTVRNIHLFSSSVCVRARVCVCVRARREAEGGGEANIPLSLALVRQYVYLTS